MACLQDRGSGSDNHNDVSDTTNGNTNANGSEAAPFRVCQPTSKDRLTYIFSKAQVRLGGQAYKSIDEETK